MNSDNNCPKTATLKALLTQSLDEQHQIGVADHIQNCAECQKNLDRMTDAGDLISASDDLSGIPHQVVLQLRETPHQLTDSTAEHTQGSSSNKPEKLASVEGFTILNHVASGATGALYRAIDTRLKRDVALKVLHQSVARSDSARTRIEREARALASVSHPNVVSVFSSGEDDSHRPFIAMEFVPGRTFSDLLQQQGPLSPARAAVFAEQAARGLFAAHEAGLIHRDVKSSNVLVENDRDQIRIIDFGLVRDDEQETRLTQDGMLAGTPAYMSPEQIVAPTAVDVRTDVYSLGIVLYELLTGVVPFRGVVRMALQQVMYAAPQPPRELNDDIPIDLQTICLKAIEKEPDQRYQSALDFAEDLRRWQHNEAIHARPVSRFEKTMRWCRRNPRITVLAGLVAFALTSTVAVTVASAYRISVASAEVQAADNAARRSADALVAQRDAAMETVRKLVFDVSPLLQQPEILAADVEKAILQTALEGLNKVGQSAEDTGEVDYNTAHALQQLGQALYQADELDSAEAQLQRALRLVDQMQRNGENVDAIASLHINVLTSLANIDWDLSQTEQERNHYEAALKVAEKWQQRMPTSDEATLALATVCNLLGEHLASEGNLTESERLFERSRVLLTSLPEDPIVRMELAAAETGLDESSVEETAPETEYLKRQLRIDLRSARSQYDESPDDPAHGAVLLRSLLGLADWHIVFGDSERAVTLLQTAEEIVPSGDDEDQLLCRAMILRRHGDACFSGGFSLNKARKAYAKVLELKLRPPVNNLPALKQLTLEHIRSELAIGKIYTLQGKVDQARALIDEASEKLDGVGNDINATELRTRLQLESAWISFYSDDLENARNQLQQARSLWQSRPVPAEPNAFVEASRTETESEIAELTAALDDGELP